MSAIQRPIWGWAIATTVLVVAVVCYAHAPRERGERMSASQASQLRAIPAAKISTRAPADMVASTQTPAVEDSLPVYAAGKYAPLFEQLFLPPAKLDELRRLLVARERVAVGLNTARQSNDPDVGADIAGHEQLLAAAEASLRTFLHPSDYAVFEILKDSDIEQFQIDDYAGGMSNVAPLSAKDRVALLRIKLRYRQHFREVLNASGLLQHDLAPAERAYALRTVSAALEETQAGYLGEARQYLYDDEQYTLLANYETSELAAELAKLASMANGG